MPGEHRDLVARDGTNLFNRNVPVVDGSGVKRWLPGVSKIRGVNLGSLFIIEPWMSNTTWNNMGCGDSASEFDCVKLLGQDKANAAWAQHWDSFITQDDIQRMTSYGLNTIRVPVGYWMREDLVDRSTEYFPEGGLAYLERLCGWASDAGLFIIIDLHGAPGAQQLNAFTGQVPAQVGFYNSDNYERALKFLEWMANMTHTNNNFRNVGMLEVVNEPENSPDDADSVRSNYYPQAFTRIRAVEQQLGLNKSRYLHIQMMDQRWGSGDPNQYLTDTYFAAYDSHTYLKFSNTPVDQNTYITTSCNDDRSGSTPTIVGEFSMAVPDAEDWTPQWDPNSSSNKEFYQRWFAALITEYEKQVGWIFWTWKNDLGDLRWEYDAAVQAGIIPKDLQSVYNMNVCG
ncbi:Glycoside hydrolase superfamily [Elaphomyces granulatus]|jgi:aryl-phospho-beta-D-glucosidase BglC (GH1 family)